MLHAVVHFLVSHHSHYFPSKMCVNDPVLPKVRRDFGVESFIFSCFNFYLMKTKLIFLLMIVLGMYSSKAQACNELNTTYNAVTKSVIQSSDACLTTTAIDGSNSSANRIPTGTLVFYRTNQGRYGKMEILEYGHSLRVRCTTYNDNGSIFRANENLTVRGTWSCDLDNVSEAQAGADFFWNQRTSVLRSLDPLGGARFWVAKSGGTNNAAINLTGFYRADNGACGQAYIRQIGNQVYWFGEHPDGSFAHIFRGNIVGNTLTGNLWDVPKGTLLNRGTCVYNIAPNGTLNRTGGTLGCNQLVRATLPSSLPASRPMQPGSGALTGVWDCNDGAATYVREDGANFLFFSEAKNNGTRPGFSNLYIGTRSGNMIPGMWVDVPKGTLLGNGTMTLRVESDTRFVRTDAGSGYGGSVWTRTRNQTETFIGTRIRFVIETGEDDQRGNSSLYAKINFHNNTSTAEFKVCSGLASWSQAVREVALPRAVDLGLIKSITIRHDGGNFSFPDTYDNWDLEHLSATLLSSTGSRTIFDSKTNRNWRRPIRHTEQNKESTIGRQ